MANFVRLRPSGMWTLSSVVLAEEFEAIDATRPKLINASEGSTHAPTGDITIGGTGRFKLTGDSQFDSIVSAALKAAGTFTIASASEMRVASGGLFLVQSGGIARVQSGGEIEVQSGGIVEWKSGAEAQFKGIATFFEVSETTFRGLSTLIAEAGSAFNLSGDVTFADDTWPKLDPARVWERHSLFISCSTEIGGVPQASKVVSDLANGVDAIKISSTTSSAERTLIELDVVDGSPLTQVDVTTRGTGNAASTTLPSYEIWRQKGTGAFAAISGTTPDAHTLANYITNVITTTVTPASPHTIDRSYRYFLVVFHGFNVGASSGGQYIYDACAKGSATEFRLP